MLVVTLKDGERTLVKNLKTGEEIWVMLVRAGEGKSRIGIDAPGDYDIVREKLLARSGQEPGEGLPA